ncbi:tetratricopeptide repeat protein [bacterium]|nr:tetratricopeptide repeat protein [candidate division CSSED10-310 bacterium]
MRQSLSVILTLLAVFAMLPAAFAYTTIEGKVEDLKSEPVHGAVVRLIDKNRGEHDKVMSNKKGEFELRNIPNGLWFVEVTKDGYQKSEVRLDLDNISGSRTETLEITLYPPASDLGGGLAAQLYLPPGTAMDREAVKAFECGMKKDETGNYKDALEEFDKSVRIDPSFSRGYTFIGIEQERLAMRDKAKEAFEKAISLNPNDPIPRVNLGGILNSEKDYDGAIRHLEKAVELDSSIARAHLYLGQTYYNNGQYEKAVQPLQTAGSLEPDTFPMTFGLLGNVFYKLQDYRQSRAAFKRFLELDPNNPNADKIKGTIESLDQMLSSQPGQ